MLTLKEIYPLAKVILINGLPVADNPRSHNNKLLHINRAVNYIYMYIPLAGKKYHLISKDAQLTFANGKWYTIKTNGVRVSLEIEFNTGQELTAASWLKKQLGAKD